jgi:hypothetical protein
MGVPLLEFPRIRPPIVEGCRWIVELGGGSLGDLVEAAFILTILVFLILHEGLEPIQLCEDTKDLLLRVLDPCFIGFNLLLHLDVYQMRRACPSVVGVY